MNGHTFSLSEKDVAFAFSYTRESTDFSDYEFTIKVCRDEALTCNTVINVPNEAGVTPLPFTDPPSVPPVGLVSLLFILASLLLFTNRQLKRSATSGYRVALLPPSRYNSALRNHSMTGKSVVSRYACLLSMVFLLSCGTETVTRDASPALARQAMMTLNDTGVYYWQVTASQDGQDPDTSQVYKFTRVVASSVERTAVTLNAGDNVGEPLTVPGATSFVFSGGCSPDFAIDASGQITVAAIPTTAGPQTCTLTLSDGTSSADTMVTINYPMIAFNMASYSFSIFNNPASPIGVNTPVDSVTANAVGGSPTYSLASCAGFQINSTGQISTSAANPAVGTRNCMVTATSGTDTASVPVTIDVQTLCTATTLPNDGQTLTLGPQNGSGQSCGGWEVAINWPDSSGDLLNQVRVYRFVNLALSRQYIITYTAVSAAGYNPIATSRIRHQESSITNTSSGSNITLTPCTMNPCPVGSTDTAATSPFSVSGTEYHINFLQLIGDSTLTVTLLPN